MPLLFQRHGVAELELELRALWRRIDRGVVTIARIEGDQTTMVADSLKGEFHLTFMADGIPISVTPT